MRVACVTPDWSTNSGFFPTDTVRPPKQFPIEWGYLRGALNCDLEIYDCYRFDQAISSVKSRLRSNDVDVLIISSTPSYLFWRCPPLDISLVSEYVRLIREDYRAKVVIVGPHGTTDPSWVKARVGCDFVFLGEVDAITADDLSAMAEGRDPQDGVFPASEKCREEVNELGECVYCADDLLNSMPHHWMPEASAEFRKYMGASVLVESSRGCAFDCAFCLRSGFRRRLRLKELDKFESEILSLQAKGMKYCFLIDETFGSSWRHSSQVCEVLGDYGIKFGAQTRPDLITDSRVSMMARSGCRYLEIGTEALSENHLKHLGKFRSIEKVRMGEEQAVSQIEYVGRNIIDVSNPDLAFVRKKQFWTQVDWRGELAPAFIPYPSTRMGDRILGNAASSRPVWEHAQARYQMYLLANEYALVRAILRSARWIREGVVKLLPIFEGLLKSFGKEHFVSRFERLHLSRSVLTPKRDE